MALPRGSLLNDIFYKLNTTICIIQIVVLSLSYGKYFCDCKEESKQLTQFMLNGSDVTMFAIRRLGKTGLIDHVFYPFKKNKILFNYTLNNALNTLYKFFA